MRNTSGDDELLSTCHPIPLFFLPLPLFGPRLFSWRARRRPASRPEERRRAPGVIILDRQVSISTSGPAAVRRRSGGGKGRIGGLIADLIARGPPFSGQIANQMTVELSRRARRR